VAGLGADRQTGTAVVVHYVLTSRGAMPVAGVIPIARTYASTTPCRQRREPSSSADESSSSRVHKSATDRSPWSPILTGLRWPCRSGRFRCGAPNDEIHKTEGRSVHRLRGAGHGRMRRGWWGWRRRLVP
jgi:hypothetical protein